MKSSKILITGALGQLGVELAEVLMQIYKKDNIIFSDVRYPESPSFNGQFELLDVLDKNEIDQVIERHNIKQVYHLAAILSAKAEKDTLLAWKINIEGLLNILESARIRHIDKVFWPSSIAIFGPDTPKVNTPQSTIMNPDTVYGISKLAGERWCAYFNEHYNMDVRCLRYPGLIGYKSMPGGGTTDYAVEIFHSAIKGEVYSCYLDKNVQLPMMYMDDAVRATVELMQAEKSQLSINTGYNISGMSMTTEELYYEIRKYYPDFTITYQPDYRQDIALSWPESIDDSYARQDWNWKPEYDLKRMTKEMLNNIPVNAIIG